MLSEEELIRDLLTKAPIPRDSRVVLGIGDDCAIYRQPGSREDLLFTTDMLLENVHFRRKTHPAEAVGHKALARSLSDIAAMGGEPRFCLLSLALPRWADTLWVDRFYEGFLALAKETGTPLAGGDLAGAEKFACDVTVCGAVPSGKALRRSGARPGDRIYVSGQLGASALGLETGKGSAWERHLRPESRLRLGKFLREKLRATAAIDLSDGLSLDLRRLCLASGAAAAIQSPPAFPKSRRRHFLHGGEDYELLFTLPAGVRPPRLFDGVPLTGIGRILPAAEHAAGTVLMNGRSLPALGYDHFTKR